MSLNAFQELCVNDGKFWLFITVKSLYKADCLKLLITVAHFLM